MLHGSGSRRLINQPMKTIEELHAEAAVNMQILRTTQFNAKCLRLCWLLLLAAAVIAFTL